MFIRKVSAIGRKPGHIYGDEEEIAKREAEEERLEMEKAKKFDELHH